MKFLGELKRRKVLNTASLYVVGSWIAVQVVEVLAEAGLPPSTMRNLLVLLSFGFPVVLVVGWFFDISKDGISKTKPMHKDEPPPDLKFIDYALMIGLAAVVAVDAWILSIPPQENAQTVAATTSQQRTIAVLVFEDRKLAEKDDAIGEALAGELRSAITRIAGLRVLGPETSAMLSAAGESRLDVARGLMITALIMGEVSLKRGELNVIVRLIGVPAGNELWSTRGSSPVGDAVAMQNDLVRQIIAAVAPNLDPNPQMGQRAVSGDCAPVYDLYLRGKQLARISVAIDPDAKERGIMLLREAVTKDEQCALAWEALATNTVDWTMPGFVKAGAAARRALELNDSLPEAWAVLAEIAEEEQRWSESEEYFLRALYADPTNPHANAFYSEALLARGRVREALHYALEAYRYEPASWRVNWRVSLTAMYLGDGDLTIKHIEIARELMGRPRWVFWDQLAEGYLLLGEQERALEIYAEMGVMPKDWFVDCVRSYPDPGKVQDITDGMRTTLNQHRAGELSDHQSWVWTWQMIRCAAWTGQPDFVFELLLQDDVPTEGIFINMFRHDGTAIRQDPRFRDLVVESGLLDYWREWGWADYCEPDGESFRCD